MLQQTQNDRGTNTGTFLHSQYFWCQSKELISECDISMPDRLPECCGRIYLTFGRGELLLSNILLLLNVTGLKVQ